MLAIRTGYIQAETEKAIMIELATGDMRGTLRQAWLPKSQIEILCKKDRSEYLIWVPEWLDRAKQLGASDQAELDWLGIDLDQYEPSREEPPAPPASTEEISCTAV